MKSRNYHTGTPMGTTQGERLNLQELSNLTGISNQLLETMKRTIIKKSIMATSSLWQTSMGCP